jgi:hypothetical protein
MKGIDKEPAFAWWLPTYMSKKKCVINSVKTQDTWKSKHKFGVEIPATVEHALSSDRAMGAAFWKDAIEKDMKNNQIAFKFLYKDEGLPSGYKFIRCSIKF